MGCTEHKIDHLVRESLAVVQELQWWSHMARGWELLQERNPHGDVIGPQPYSEAAIDEFRTACTWHPDDSQALHHLAICCHARAWDMELAHDARAPDYWRAAIDCWCKLATHRDFWDELAAKLHQCDPKADASVVRDARDQLTENLLDVHVDFVRHYCELNQLDQALTHVRVVRETHIRPALKKKMVGKIFGAMTDHMDRKVCGREGFQSTSICVSRFLDVFHDLDYVPALRLYLELCTSYLARLSYQADWPEILDLVEKAKPVVRRLAKADDLDKHPLARTALAEFCETAALRAYDKAESCLPAGQDAAGSVRHEEAQSTYQLAIDVAMPAWGVSRDGSVLRRLLVACLHRHAECLNASAMHILKESGPSEDQARTAAIGLYKRAIRDLEEVARCEPQDQAVTANLKIVRENIRWLELSGFGDADQLDFDDGSGDQP